MTLLRSRAVANCPVGNVSWRDAQDFINRLHEMTGMKYRLPWEAEWEYAARSGGKSEKYAGGNDVDNVAWYDSIEIHPVGTKAAEGFGLYDMSGNVWQWVQDWYDEKYYGKSPQKNPGGPSSGQYRVLRGGSWYDSAPSVRAAFRGWSNPDNRGTDYGFRLAGTAGFCDSLSALRKNANCFRKPVVSASVLLFQIVKIDKGHRGTCNLRHAPIPLINCLNTGFDFPKLDELGCNILLLKSQ